VLDHRLLAFSQLLGQLRYVFFGVWLLQLLEDFLEKSVLPLRLLQLGCRWCISFCLFLGLFVGNTLDKFLAYFSDSVVIVSAVGTLILEEGELWFVLFAFNQDFLEFGAVQGYVLRRLLKQLCVKRELLLISPGGMMRPIIDLL
jgi:hypothetical protein